MKRVHRLQLLLPALLLLLSGCRVQRPDDVISPKRMEAFLYDYHLAQSMAKELPNSDRYKSPLFLNYLYEKHSLTEEQVNRSLEWYTRYPDELANVYTKMAVRAEREHKRATAMMEKIEKRSFSITSGDSVDLWYLKRNIRLASAGLLNKITFNIQADTTFYTSDTITWSLRTSFLTPKGDTTRAAQAYLSLQAVYPNDSTVTLDSLVCGDALYTFAYTTSDSIHLTRLRGSVTYLDSTFNKRHTLLLSGMRLIRRHKRDLSAVPATD